MGSLIETLISSVILTVGIVNLLVSMLYLRQSQENSLLVAQVVMVRNNLMNILQKQNAWANTIQNNYTSANGSQMACLVNNTDCTGISGPFDIYDESGALLYQPTSGISQGFTKEGLNCSSFVAPGTPGDPSCPLRLNLTWTPICPLLGPCLNPLIRVRGHFQFNSPQISSLYIFGPLDFAFIR